MDVTKRTGARSERESMATIINLADRPVSLAVRKPAHAAGARILLFTGVRFERLDQTAAQGGGPEAPPADDQALRNRAG